MVSSLRLAVGCKSAGKVHRFEGSKVQLTNGEDIGIEAHSVNLRTLRTFRNLFNL